MSGALVQLRALLLLLASCAAVLFGRLGGRGAPRRPLRIEVLRRFLRRGIEDALPLPIAVARRRVPAVLIPRALRRRLRGPEARPLGACPAELLTPTGWTEGGPTILYLHGGGYVACSPASHRALAAALAAAAGARLFSLDYRLAPEHPFPAAVDDCVAAYRALLAEGLDGPRLVLAGDSSGGGLVLATLLAARGLGLPLPAGAVLLSPWVDLTFSGASLRRNEESCYLVRASLDVYRRAYLGEGDPREPLASPLFADLRGLPPLLVQAGAGEMLRDEVEALCRAAEAAAVPVTLELEPGLFHAYQTAVAILPEAQRAVARAGAFVRARCAAL